MKKITKFFDAREAYESIALHLLIKWRLTAGVWLCIIHSSLVDEVQTFFVTLHLPLLSVSLYLAVDTEFVCWMDISIDDNLFVRKKQNKFIHEPIAKNNTNQS